MAKKRQSFSKDFKAKITLETLQEESTIQEIAVKYGVHPNQVCSTDITYIKLSTGIVYLMAIIDWFSRKVLSWRVFNTKNWTGRCFYNFIDLCLRNRDSYQNGTYRTCASLYCTERVCRSRADLYRASNCREVG